MTPSEGENTLHKLIGWPTSKPSNPTKSIWFIDFLGAHLPDSRTDHREACSLALSCQKVSLGAVEYCRPLDPHRHCPQAHEEGERPDICQLCKGEK